MINKKPASPEALKLKMADLCARSEQCEYDIREKLRRKMLPIADIDRIICFLIENRFIDDERYAKSFTNDKMRFAGWGRNKIKQALTIKRITYEIISEDLQEIESKEDNKTLFKAATTKARNLDLEEYDDRAKLYRFLISRGYESSLAVQAIAAIRRLNKEE